ncbi:MAG: hypothetical protein H0Z28_06555 [Archaeoglobus sp.]|nr:hypothetical protein [Archaeoglobus sp.]
MTLRGEGKRLEDTCPNCGTKIVSKTKKGFLTSKTWLECPECGKIWKNKEEYNKDFRLAMDKEELERIQETGKLPVLYTDDARIILRKNEELHLYEAPVGLLEERTRSYSYRSKSMGLRIKVARGVYLTPRIGGGTGLFTMKDTEQTKGLEKPLSSVLRMKIQSTTLVQDLTIKAI